MRDDGNEDEMFADGNDLEGICSALARLEDVLYATGADDIEALLPDVDRIYSAQMVLEQDAASATRRRMAMQDAARTCLRLTDAIENDDGIRADVGTYGISVLQHHLRQAIEAMSRYSQGVQ